MSDVNECCRKKKMSVRGEGHPGKWKIAVLYRLVIKRFFVKLTFEKVLKKVREPAMGNTLRKGVPNRRNIRQRAWEEAHMLRLSNSKVCGLSRKNNDRRVTGDEVRGSHSQAPGGSEFKSRW